MSSPDQLAFCSSSRSSPPIITTVTSTNTATATTTMHFSLAQVLLVLPAVSIAAAVPVNSTDIGGKFSQSPTPSTPVANPLHSRPRQAHPRPEPLPHLRHAARPVGRVRPEPLADDVFRHRHRPGHVLPVLEGRHQHTVRVGLAGRRRMVARRCELQSRPLGDQQYYNMLKTSRGNWSKSYGCTTG